MVHLDPCLIKLGFSNDPLVRNIPDEMVVSVRYWVKEVNKYFVLSNPATSDERVRKVIADHGIIVKANQFIDFDLSLFNLRLSSLLLREDP